MVVDKSSAHLDDAWPGIETYSFARNHFQLNKFEKPDDDNFQFLCDKLKNFKTAADNHILPLVLSDMQSE